jgi:hypothetical protein
VQQAAVHALAKPAPAKRNNTTGDRVLADFVKELTVRKYHIQTMIHYRALCADYLKWLRRPPAASDAPAVRQYLKYVKEEKKSSPKAVRQATEVIRFLYENVLKMNIAVDPEPQSKTAKQAPKGKNGKPAQSNPRKKRPLKSQPRNPQANIKRKNRYPPKERRMPRSGA